MYFCIDCCTIWTETFCISSYAMYLNAEVVYACMHVFIDICLFIYVCACLSAHLLLYVYIYCWLTSPPSRHPLADEWPFSKWWWWFWNSWHSLFGTHDEDVDPSFLGSTLRSPHLSLAVPKCELCVADEVCTGNI